MSHAVSARVVALAGAAVATDCLRCRAASSVENGQNGGRGGWLWCGMALLLLVAFLPAPSLSALHLLSRGCGGAVPALGGAIVWIAVVAFASERRAGNVR